MEDFNIGKMKMLIDGNDDVTEGMGVPNIHFNSSLIHRSGRATLYMHTFSSFLPPPSRHLAPCNADDAHADSHPLCHPAMHIPKTEMRTIKMLTDNNLLL